jgi:hypothetical protein
MSKIKKSVLINLLHTNAGEESFRKSVSRANVESFARTLSDNIVSAQRYYVGNPDGKFITPKDFDELTVKAGKAYETINTLMGNDNAEFMRFSEGKKQTPGLISAVGLQKIADMFVLLFAFANDGEEITYDTVRACRQTEIAETKEGQYDSIDALQSSTKATVEEIVALGYGNKNKLAICKFHFHPGAVVLDMVRFGKDYLKPEEKEVLLLTGNKYQAKCLGYSDKFYGKDGQPALMYDVDVFEPDEFYWHVHASEEELKKIVFDKDMISKVNSFFKALNDNIGKSYPTEPEGYREWKEAFKMYVYNELNKIYTLKL